MTFFPKKIRRNYIWTVLVGSLVIALIYQQICQNRIVYVQVTGKIPSESFVISMPKKDKYRLEEFFRRYCILEEWAYTLIGVKPVTVSVDSKMQFSLYAFAPRNLAAQSGWSIWGKYKHYFQHSKFCIFTDRKPSDPKQNFLVLVDRSQFNQVVQENANNFQSILHLDPCNPAQLLELANYQSFVYEVLRDNNFLLGIILGYGRENARLFQEYSQGKNIVLEPIWDLAAMDQILDHWNRKSYFEHWNLSDLFYPSFVSDKESEETRTLRDKYAKARETIVQYYEGKDFLEATFSLLNQR
jgi:hypothetical protein